MLCELTTGNLLSPSDLSNMLISEECKVIDISTKEQFLSSHIEGNYSDQILHAPELWSYLLLDENGGIAGMQSTLSKVFNELGVSHENKLVFTEASHADGLGQSCRGLFLARLFGWDPAHLHVLNGGNALWRHEGFSMKSGEEKAVPNSSNQEFSLNLKPLASRDEVVRIAQGLSPGVVLLDCRDVEEWADKVPAPGGQDPELPSGRIPGSINLNWDVFLTSDSSTVIDGLEPAVIHQRERLQEIVDCMQLHSHTPIVLYCYKGARASLVYKVLHDILGFCNVKIYFAGWADYARHATGLPFESSNCIPSASRTYGHNKGYVMAIHSRRLKTQHSQAEEGYGEINLDEIESLKEKHAWFVTPLFRASDHVRRTPFFGWLERLSSVQEFKPSALNLWGHSATFPQVMGAMLARTPLTQHRLMSHYAQHLFEEVEHHNWLEEWMITHGLITDSQDLLSFNRTPETNSCVNVAWNMVQEGDFERWMCCLNSAIERLSNDLFKVLAVRMRELGAGHKYFDVHVGADEFHSIMGLRHVRPRDPNSKGAQRLIHSALEGVKTWCDMLHSWINHPYRVQFNLDGYAVSPTPLLGEGICWNA